MYFIPNWFNKPAQAAVIRFFILSQPNTVDFCLYVVEHTIYRETQILYKYFTIYRETHCLCSECTGLLCCAASHCLPSVKSGLIFSFLDFTVQSKHGASPPPLLTSGNHYTWGTFGTPAAETGSNVCKLQERYFNYFIHILSVKKKDRKGTKKPLKKSAPLTFLQYKDFKTLVGYPYF